MSLTFTTVEKDGHFFVFNTRERKNPIKFDCIKGCFVTPRKVFPEWTVPDHFITSWYDNYYEFRKEALAYNFIKALRDGFKEYNTIEEYKGLVSILETVYANKDLLSDDNCSFYMPFRKLEKFPHGFFKWLRAEKKPLVKTSLNEFILKDYYKNPKVADLLKDFADLYDTEVIINAKVDYKTLCTLAQVHAIFKKEFSWDARSNFLDFYREIFCYKKEILLPEIDKWLDTNRNYEYNRKLARIYLDKGRNERILNNENKIRDIEKLETENLCIKVPNTIEDFTEEGKMQNNCVGSYYHDDIACGRDLVYFIRKKENPSHSYITCRFHLADDENRTVEKRIVNNGCVSDKEARDFIIMIDEKIRALLKKGR